MTHFRPTFLQTDDVPHTNLCTEQCVHTLTQTPFSTINHLHTSAFAHPIPSFHAKELLHTEIPHTDVDLDQHLVHGMTPMLDLLLETDDVTHSNLYTRLLYPHILLHRQRLHTDAPTDAHTHKGFYAKRRKEAFATTEAHSLAEICYSWLSSSSCFCFRLLITFRVPVPRFVLPQRVCHGFKF